MHSGSKHWLCGAVYEGKSQGLRLPSVHPVAAKQTLPMPLKSGFRHMQPYARCVALGSEEM